MREAKGRGDGSRRRMSLGEETPEGVQKGASNSHS